MREVLKDGTLPLNEKQDCLRHIVAFADTTIVSSFDVAVCHIHYERRCCFEKN